MIADDSGAQSVDRRLALTSASIAGFYGLGLLGLALLPLLARDQPRLLILLNPATSVLVLVSARVDLASFIALAMGRRIIFHVLCFLLGVWYGQAAVRWIEGRGGRATELVGFVESAFARVSWLVLLLIPGPIPAVLAGAGRMGRARFLALDIAGTLLSVLVARFAAGLASDPLGTVLRFSDQHAVPLTALGVAATTIWLLVRWWQGRARRTER